MKNVMDAYFMDDRREAGRLESKVNARAFVSRYLEPWLPGGTASILEAGCGPGMFLEVLADWWGGYEITGIDISADRVNLAKKRLSGSVSATVMVASVYDIPAPDNHFDFIYSRFLFEYLDRPVQAAKELFRVCKPGGMLFIQDLDNQFTFYPAVSEKLKDCLQLLKKSNGFDPEIGRKLFSIGRSAGFSLANADIEGYHKIFGCADKETRRLWEIKLDIAFGNMEKLFGESNDKLKAEILDALEDQYSMMYSTVFSMLFTKPCK